MTQPILWEVHIYPLVKTHSILWEKSTILGEVVYYPLGKTHSILGGKKKHIYPMVSDTLSSGKWHIILWEKKLIPSGNWTMGNWKITVESFTINLSIHCRNKILLDKLYEGSRAESSRRFSEFNILKVILKSNSLSINKKNYININVHI